MDARVAVELARPAKGASALVTLVRLLARMAPEVDDQLAGGGEAFAAHTALMRLLAAVELHVDSEVLRPAERLATRRALERFLAGVDSPVPSELAHPREPLRAHGARERPLAGVDPGVHGQRAAALEALAALRALVLAALCRRKVVLRRVVGVLRLVPHEPLLRDEAFVARRAVERPLSGVGPHVHVQVSLVREPFLTHRACIRPRLSGARPSRFGDVVICIFVVAFGFRLHLKAL